MLLNIFFCFFYYFIWKHSNVNELFSKCFKIQYFWRLERERKKEIFLHKSNWKEKNQKIQSKLFMSHLKFLLFWNLYDALLVVCMIVHCWLDTFYNSSIYTHTQSRRPFKFKVGREILDCSYHLSLRQLTQSPEPTIITDQQSIREVDSK